MGDFSQIKIQLLDFNFDGHGPRRIFCWSQDFDFKPIAEEVDLEGENQIDFC